VTRWSVSDSGSYCVKEVSISDAIRVDAGDYPSSSVSHREPPSIVDTQGIQREGSIPAREIVVVEALSRYDQRFFIRNPTRSLFACGRIRFVAELVGFLCLC
jgi:hypothetical protein